MVDIREQELARKIVNYSCKVKKGEKVWVEYSETSEGFICALLDEIFKCGGYPYLKSVDRQYKSLIMKNASKEYYDFLSKHDCALMNDCDCVILISGEGNSFELSNVNAEENDLYETYYSKPVHLDIRIKKRWVLLRYPTLGFAQNARMNTHDFEDYFFKVCNLDYGKMCDAMERLRVLMEKTDKVRIIARDTNLEFSIKGMNAVKCCGECNIPDGEIYTAPVKNSINGKILFNIPSLNNGIEFHNIKLVFEKGRIIDFDCNEKKAFEKIINTDLGSRYIGEFAFGVNPYVDRPILDILFDEKMAGSIHMAIGNSYDDAANGNKSAIHWDLILSQKPEFGGGEIYFDDVLIRKDGKFILPQLIALNEENLL